VSCTAIIPSPVCPGGDGFNWQTLATQEVTSSGKRIRRIRIISLVGLLVVIWLSELLAMRYPQLQIRTHICRYYVVVVWLAQPLVDVVDVLRIKGDPIDVAQLRSLCSIMSNTRVKSAVNAKFQYQPNL